jgi:DNA-binding transcriptional LysR family regulator
MNLGFRQLRYAVTAAEFGNLSRAAVQLNVSQPSISAAITQIEAEFGQAIFVRRRGSGVSLTAFGRSVIDQAQRVLGALRGLEQLGLAAREPFGRLVLGCFDELAPYYAPALSRQLQMLHPKVELVIVEEGFAELQRRLAEGSVDLALTYELERDPALVAEPLSELRPHALLAPSHPLALQETVSLAELAEYPLIQIDQPSSWRHMLQLFQDRGLSATVGSRARSFELLRSLVANGFGVAVVYSQPWGDRCYDGSPLCRRPIRDELPSQRIVMARRSDDPATAAGDALIALAQQWFAAQGAQE